MRQELKLEPLIVPRDTLEKELSLETEAAIEKSEKAAKQEQEAQKLTSAEKPRTALEVIEDLGSALGMLLAGDFSYDPYPKQDKKPSLALNPRGKNAALLFNRSTPVPPEKELKQKLEEELRKKKGGLLPKPRGSCP